MLDLTQYVDLAIMCYIVYVLLRFLTILIIIFCVFWYINVNTCKLQKSEREGQGMSPEMSSLCLATMNDQISAQKGGQGVVYT